MSDYEFRSCGEELRVISDPDQPPKIVGHVAVFGSRSLPIPLFEGSKTKFVEIMARGAFKKFLADGNDVIALVEHNLRERLARRGSGTLQLWEDDKGLAFEIAPPNTEVGRSTLEHVRRKDFAGMSFRFKADADEWDLLANPMLRTVKSVSHMPEVSVVMIPAYPATTAEVRSHVEELLGTGDAQTSDIPETTGNETQTDTEVERRLKFYDAQGVK